MIVTPKIIAGILLKGIEASPSQGTVSFRDLQFVAFGGIGAYLLVLSAQRLVGTLATFALSGNPLPLRDYDMILFLVQFLIGIWMICGAKGIREVVEKFRNAGVN